MKINTLFEIINKALLSVRWENECEDSFKQCFNLWRDIEYLEKFFEQYKSDLRSNFWQLTVEYAVFKAVKEANEFEADILNCAIRQERPHPALELKKLEYISEYLKTNGIDDESDYGFIEIEIK